MSEYQTEFGSLGDYEKGRIEIIDDDPKHYTFSNVFEVANNSAPYEKVVVGKNLENVIEVLRAEGDSDWFSCSHDEFALVMDGEVEIHFHQAQDDEIVPEDDEGSRIIEGEPKGPKMGRVVLRTGHQAILPKGSVYQYRADKVGVIILQTLQGPHSVEKWAEICLS